MLKSLDFGETGADQMGQWRALLKKIDVIGGIPGFMKAFDNVSMVDVRLVFQSLWPHGPWDHQGLRKLMKLWTDVADMGGTQIFYETVKGLSFERLRYLVAELRSLRFIGHRSDEGTLESLFKLCAAAGGGREFVDALTNVDMDYFTANMALLHFAQLRDDDTVQAWERLTRRMDQAGGVYRFIERHEKRENSAKLCRYCSNELWLTRSLQLKEQEGRKAKKTKGWKNYDPPVVSKLAAKLTQSMPPGAVLPRIEIDAPDEPLAVDPPAYIPFAWLEAQDSPQGAASPSPTPTIVSLPP
jgi:hypothetical protein